MVETRTGLPVQNQADHGEKNVCSFEEHEVNILYGTQLRMTKDDKGDEHRATKRTRAVPPCRTALHRCGKTVEVDDQQPDAAPHVDAPIATDTALPSRPDLSLCRSEEKDWVGEIHRLKVTWRYTLLT